MRMIANSLVTTSLVLVAAFAAVPAKAANVEATSAVDAVTVYPDGASVTRVITAEIAAGDNTLVLKDFRSRWIHPRCGLRARRARN